MAIYHVMSYKLKSTVKPADVLSALDRALKDHSAEYQYCLFEFCSSVIEFEHDGVLHSNRSRNTVNRICKDYPQMVPFLSQTCEDMEDGSVRETVLIRNYSEEDNSPLGTVDDSLIRQMVAKIPRPYNPDHIKILFDKIRFFGISQPTTGMEPPVHYILYEREQYGSERHSYIYFSADVANIDPMRKLFFEFARMVPGRYDGTEIQNH